MDGLYEQCIRPVCSLRPSGSITPLPPCLWPHLAATCDGESESAGPAPQAGYRTPTWVILVLHKCCTRLTSGVFLGDLNNSHAGNSAPSFLMPFPVCDESLYYGETSNIPKMSHCSCRAEKRLQSAGGSAKEELNMSTVTLSSVCGLHLNATL